MGYASTSGRAITNPDSPRAFAVCDRCGIWYNHSALRWQFDYRGRTLQNIRILVCETCEDDPQPQLKPRILPPDPLPIANARVEQFCEDEEDDRYTTNPALPNVDVATIAPTLLAGLQLVDGIQVVEGDLVLVKNQTDTTKNGIYRASAGVWSLMAFDNDTKEYYVAGSRGITYYGALGYHQGAVNVSRGLTQFSKLYQISFDDPGALFSAGTNVTAFPAFAAAVNHYDFFTGIYMAGGEERGTETDQTRVTQEVGQASGNLNETPGFSNLVPGSCDIGIPNAVPYGCGSGQGLPPGMDSLPYSGPLWPSLQNQSIGHWLNNSAQGTVWLNSSNLQISFQSSGFWANPGPGAPFRPIAFHIDQHDWINNVPQVDYWNNTLNQDIPWRNGGVAGVFNPGGDILWKNEKCVIVLWNNNSQQNVNFAEIYPNAIPPNKPGPWPWGWQ